MRQLFFFGCVGGAATLTHYVVALVLIEKLNLYYLLANAIAYSVAVSVSFFGHTYLTFNTTSSAHKFSKFLITSLASLALSQAILFLLMGVLSVDARLALVLVVLFVPIFTFIVSKFWVFTDNN